MIKYTKLDKTFKTRRDAAQFESATRAFGNNKFDRTYISKGANGYYIMYFTFPKAIRDKIEGIEKMSRRTGKVISYYKAAYKPLSWINAKHLQLLKTLG
jgi:hypothetical protein